MSLHRRRSGLRSNQKKLVNTVQEDTSSQRLKTIPERDISSSEKPPKTLLLNDTILEEREEPMEGLSENYEEEREIRRGIMSRLSKRMASDFTNNKKQSIGALTQ
jgi:hypothetical protein